MNEKKVAQVNTESKAKAPMPAAPAATPPPVLTDEEIARKLQAQFDAEAGAPRPAAHPATPPDKKTDEEMARKLLAAIDSAAMAKLVADFSKFKQDDSSARKKTDIKASLVAYIQSNSFPPNIPVTPEEIYDSLFDINLLFDDAGRERNHGFSNLGNDIRNFEGLVSDNGKLTTEGEQFFQEVIKDAFRPSAVGLRR